MWDANKFEIKASVKKDGKFIGEVPMKYANKPSQFTTSLEIKEAGAYDVTIYAFDPRSGNSGLDRVTFVAY